MLSTLFDFLTDARSCLAISTFATSSAIFSGDICGDTFMVVFKVVCGDIFRLAPSSPLFFGGFEPCSDVGAIGAILARFDFSAYRRTDLHPAQ